MNGTVPDWAAYTTVTVHQPSLSYVVAASNTEKPYVTVGFAGLR